MSNNHHTQFSDNYSLTKNAWNAPLGELDQVLTDIVADNQQFTGALVGSGSLGSGSLLGGGSTTQGYKVIPTMTETERDAITSPTTGLMVINSTANTVDYYNGTSWQSIGTTAGVGARTLLASGSVTNTAQVDIQNIPATYEDLVLTLQVRSYRVADTDELNVRINADTSGYNTQGRWWNSASVNTFSALAEGRIACPFIPADNQDSEWFMSLIYHFPAYARASLSTGGWYYGSHRVEPANLFYRLAAVFAYQDATTTVIDELNILANNGNMDLDYELYGIGVA